MNIRVLGLSVFLVLCLNINAFSQGETEVHAVQPQAAAAAAAARFATYRAILHDVQMPKMIAGSDRSKAGTIGVDYRGVDSFFGVLDNVKKMPPTLRVDTNRWLFNTPGVSPIPPRPGELILVTGFPGHVAWQISPDKVFDSIPGGRPRIVSLPQLVRENRGRSFEYVTVPGMTPEIAYQLNAKAQSVVANPTGYYAKNYFWITRNCVVAVCQLGRDVGLTMPNPHARFPVDFVGNMKVYNPSYRVAPGGSAFDNIFGLRPQSAPPPTAGWNYSITNPITRCFGRSGPGC